MSIKYDVILEKVSIGKELCIAQQFHSVLNLDLKEAEHIVQSAPATVMEKVSEAQALKFKQKLEALDSASIVTCKLVMNPISEIHQGSSDDLNNAYLLSEYHSALIFVNDTFKEFQDAKKELIQYEEILKEADNLAQKFQFQKVPSPSVPKLESFTPLSIKRTQDVLDNFSREIEEFSNLDRKLQDKLSNYETKLEETISQLKEENAEIRQKINIKNYKIKLVEKLVKEVCICSLVFILIVIINPTQIIKAYIAILMILIGYRLYLINQAH